MYLFLLRLLSTIMLFKIGVSEGTAPHSMLVWKQQLQSVSSYENYRVGRINLSSLENNQWGIKHYHTIKRSSVIFSINWMIRTFIFILSQWIRTKKIGLWYHLVEVLSSVTKATIILSEEGSISYR